MSTPQAAAPLTNTESLVPTRLTGQRLTVARAAWIALTALILITFVVGIPVSYRKALTISPDTAQAMANLNLPPTFPALYLVTVDTLTMLGFTVVALILFWRRSDDWMAMFVGQMLMLTAVIYSDPAYNQIMPLWIVAFLIALGETFQVIFFYIFPNGKFVPPWARWLILPLIIWRPLMWGVSYLPNLFTNVRTSAEAYGRVPQDSLDIGLMVLLMVLGIASQVYRYRRLSTQTQRQQVKWLLVGVAITVSLVGAYIFVVNVLGLFGQSSDSSNFIAFALARLSRQIALMAVPIALCISVLRYRLWDIDLLINRGIVYGALTLLYVGTVLISQAIFSAITGGQQSSIVVALSTAVIAALFQPIRRRIQRFVDRRFYPLHKHMHVTEINQPQALISNPGAFTGTQLGIYQVHELIGRGGMGEIYKGRHPTLERTVAIKVLPEGRADNATFRARFEREAKTVASLRHPNIVNVFDFGSVENTFYMVMEFIDGQELNDYLEHHKPLSVKEVFPLVNDIASALDYAHQQGVVHRDVKPSNIMVQKTTATGQNDHYRAVLMDFGIAKMLDGTSALTQTGTIGTIDYMAPEQIMAAKEVDHRADIYAFGVVVYQMLTGRVPFIGTSAGEVLYAHLQTPAADPRTLAPDLPESISAAILRTLAKNPEDRFATAGEFAAALSKEKDAEQPH